MSPTRWAKEQFVTDHKDIGATSLAIDASGRFAALGGSRCIALVDLNNSTEKRVGRNSKWPVTCSEWSKLDNHSYALGFSKLVEIYSFARETPSFVVGNLGPDGWSPYSSETPVVCLKGHTRTISDLNWSPFSGRSIATASHDSTALVWDTRDPKKPAISFSSVAATNQVKWSKTDENTLATAHDADIRIWDRRKGNIPVHYIAAHLSTINCLDWNSTVGTQLASCSSDGTVKFWDLSVLKNKAEMILQTGLPAWRAKYTPFGNGIITAVIPKVSKTRADSSSLYLWHANSLDQPVYKFVGDAGTVVEFGWRQQAAAYEIITWSKDNKLRIWNVDSNIMGLVQDTRSRATTLMGPANSVVEYGDEATPEILEEVVRASTAKSLKVKPSRLRNPSGSNLKLPPFEKPPKTPTTPTVADLQQEFALININIPNLNFEVINSSERFCVISATSADKALSVRLKVTFPPGYPNSVPPNFVFVDAKEAKERRRSLAEVKSELLKTLQSVAHSQVKRTRPCLEPCLRMFMTKLERLCGDWVPRSYPLSQVIADYSLYQDSTVPFPRTSGGRFCGADVLVFFGRPPHLQHISAPTEYTPRALSDLSAFLSTNYRVVSVTTPVSVPTSGGSAFGPSDNSSDMSLASTQLPAPVSSFYQDTSVYRTKSYSRGLRKTMSLTGHLAPTSHDHSVSSKCGPVFVYNVENLMPFRRSLGESYTFSSDVVRMCAENAAVAQAIGRKDLVQTWNLAALAASPNLNPSMDSDMQLLEPPWPVHPFGRKLITSLIDYYLNTCRDVQTAAMLGCAFSARNDRYSRMSNGLKPSMEAIAHGQTSPGTHSPYHTVGHGPVAYISSTTHEPTNEEWNLVTAVESLKRTRSNSWSDSVENDVLRDLSSQTAAAAYRVHCNEMILLRDQREADRHEANLKMIEPELCEQLDYVKQIYGDLLLRWGLHEKRAMVLKYVLPANSLDRSSDKMLDLTTECQTCKRDHKGVACKACRSINLTCAICGIGVRGLTNFCSQCGHGGHATHMSEWFSSFEVCPTGCGCHCLVNSSIS